MVLFINQTGTIGVIMGAVTNNITGSYFITLLGLMVIILLFFMVFRLPVEATVIFILPLCLVFMAFYGEFLVIGGLLLMYLGFLIAKNII